jgi:hypothetical protein
LDGTVTAWEGAIIASLCLEEEEEEEEILNFVCTVMENRHLEERERDGIMSLGWMLGN